MLCQRHCAASTAWIGRQCQSNGDCYASSDQRERLLVFGALYFVAAKPTRVWAPAIAGCAENPNGKVRYDVNGITSVAGAWMRRSDPAEDAFCRPTGGSVRRHRHTGGGLSVSTRREVSLCFTKAPGWGSFQSLASVGFAPEEIKNGGTTGSGEAATKNVADRIVLPFGPGSICSTTPNAGMDNRLSSRL
jgi:hypothetical protein